jgi:hypothetical protein
VVTANRYSHLVREHWTQYRPGELAQMSDPERFFATKGMEIQQAVIAAQEALEQALEAEPDYRARVGQLNQIRADAEHQVLAQLLPPPEDQEDPPAPLSQVQVELAAIREDLQAL